MMSHAVTSYCTVALEKKRGGGGGGGEVPTTFTMTV